MKKLTGFERGADVLSIKAIGAVNQYTEICRPYGPYNINILGGTGVIKALRRFGTMENLGAHSGAAAAAALTFTFDNCDAQTIAALSTASALIGLYVSNDTDGSFAPVTANSTTVITGTLVGGTNNNWGVGDRFSLWYVAGTYTLTGGAGSLTDPQSEEPEIGTSLVLLSTTYTTGPVLVRISQ